LLDGAVYSVRGEHDSAVFTDLPLLDFPLVIVERDTLRLMDRASAPPNKSVPSLATRGPL